MGQPTCLEKITLVWGQGSSTKSQVSKTSTGPPSNRSNNRDHKDFLRLNKPGPSEALAKTSAGPSQAPSLKVEIDVARFTRKDLDQIIQSLLQAQT